MNKSFWKRARNAPEIMNLNGLSEVQKLSGPLEFKLVD